MGKLGGEELNFSSDIDLVYLYETDQGAAGALSLHEFFARLCERVTRAIGDVGDDGFVFRVDLRLRPEGTRGPLCNSVGAAERYYESFGRPWERQAWVKARAVAGDLALGEEALAHARAVRLAAHARRRRHPRGARADGAHARRAGHRP